MAKTYGEMSLGNVGEQTLLRRTLMNSGYEYSGPRRMKGLSGLEHSVDAVGMRGQNLALVLSGPQDLGLRPTNETSTPSPKFRSEVWCRDALLRMYDISALLEREGVNVDLVLFENRRTEGLHSRLGPDVMERWVAENRLPREWRGSWQTSIYDIEIPPAGYLAEAARSAGACYLGLNDLALGEIAAICGADEGVALEQTRAAMTRLRVDQYFNPPTDELILGALALSRRQDPRIVEDVYRAAVSLKHSPVRNVIVPGTDYRDPVATARELAAVGAVEYSAEVRLQGDGREIVHRITKTAQENFVIRVLKALDVPGIVKALMEALKGRA